MPSAYKKYIGFKSIFYFCSLPLRLDTYKGCSHGCRYCFSQSLNNRPVGSFIEICAADPLHFEKLMMSVHKGASYQSLVRSCLEKRVPIHLGCLSDPFQPCELQHHVTLAFLRVLSRFEYPCYISTKTDMVADADYLSMLRDLPVVLQFSFSTLDDQLGSNLEPSAPKPSARLRAMEAVSTSGIWTVARLQPFLFPFQDATDSIFRTLSSVGSKHVVLEHLRIPTNSRHEVRQRLWDALGQDALQVYRRLGIKHSRVNYELNSHVKLHNVLTARELAHRHGMSFGSADNDFHHFSDHLCCCGMPNREEFSNIYLGHLGRAAYDGIRAGHIDFSYLDSEWQPAGSVREYLNSDCRLDGESSVSGLLRHRVRNPRASNSPSSFFGIHTDEHGDYRVDAEIVQLVARKG